MRGLVLALALVVFSGCALQAGVKIGPERFTIIELSYSGKGGETFCWEGAGWSDIGIRAVGWGQHECSATVLRD